MEYTIKAQPKIIIENRAQSLGNAITNWERNAINIKANPIAERTTLPYECNTRIRLSSGYNSQ